MHMKKTIYQRFLTACGGAFISSLALLSVLIQGKLIRTAGGICFWGGLLLEFAALFAAAKQLRKLPAEKRKSYRKMRIGLLSFRKTKAGSAADIVFLLAAVTLIVLLLCKVKAAGAVLPVLTLLYLGFQFHCLCNGRIYRTIKTDVL